MSNLSIGLQGGTGFIGSVLANALVKRGYEIKYPLETSITDATFGCFQILEDEIDLNKQEEIDTLFKDCDVLINLIGILNEKEMMAKVLPMPTKSLPVAQYKHVKQIK